MALNFFSISFFVSLLLIFGLVWAQNETCTESFECGRLGSISYPFSTEKNCGLCIVDCDTVPDPRIKLSSDEGAWFITKLHNNTISIDAPLLKDPNCYSFYNLSLPSSPSISFTVPLNITLFKCVNTLNQSLDAHFSGYEKFTNCTVDSGFDIYHKLDRDYSGLGNLPSTCTMIQMPSLPFDQKLNTTDVYKLIASEFDLEWYLSDDCSNCYQKGGQCLIDTDFQFNCSIDIGVNGQARIDKLRLIVVIVASSSGIVILTIIMFCLKKKHLIFFSKTDDYQNIERFLKNNGSFDPERYNYSDLTKMTNSFKIRIGEGGYGSVYKGKTRDGHFVAVKILNKSKGNGEEFINEVASISRTSHVNIVRLLGFCFEGNKKALIYEFMANGSLEKFIYDDKSLIDRQLGWKTLYNISVGIARGLEYLHRGCNTQILHFDIKPHNILLDDDFSPKISDFGLSKLSTAGKSNVSMFGARGTIGYIAPELVSRMFGRVSHKSDVYSYGMMILEIVGGRKNVDVEVDHSSEIYYPHWIYKQLELNQELEFDGIVNVEENEKARKMIIVSLWCIQTDPSTRPSMTKVVEMLEGNLESLQIPPKPYLYSNSSSHVESSNIQIM